jgi:hypothetical protein
MFKCSLTKSIYRQIFFALYRRGDRQGIACGRSRSWSPSRIPCRQRPSQCTLDSNKYLYSTVCILILNIFSVNVSGFNKLHPPKYGRYVMNLCGFFVSHKMFRKARPELLVAFGEKICWNKSRKKQSNMVCIEVTF